MKSCGPYNLLILLAFLAAGCEKEIQWTFQTDNNFRLVVDGIITNELKPQCIKLAHTSSDQNQGWQPVSNAIVVVSDSLTDYEFAESDGEAGHYYSASFQAVVNQKYRLMITYGSNIYEASAESVPVTPPGEAVFVKDQDKNLFRFVYKNEGQPSMTEVFYDWAALPDYCVIYGYCNAQETFYTLNNVDVNEIFSAPKQTIYFPEGTVIIRKKYSLNEAHQEFVRSLLMETEWSGGIFDTQHGNTATNISNGALGFFATCMVMSDTLLAE